MEDAKFLNKLILLYIEDSFEELCKTFASGDGYLPTIEEQDEAQDKFYNFILNLKSFEFQNEAPEEADKIMDDFYIVYADAHFIDFYYFVLNYFSKKVGFANSFYSNGVLKALKKCFFEKQEMIFSYYEKDTF